MPEIVIAIVNGRRLSRGASTSEMRRKSQSTPQTVPTTQIVPLARRTRFARRKIPHRSRRRRWPKPTRSPDWMRGTGCRGNVLRHCEERSDEAIHSFFVPRNGLLRGVYHRARIRATRWLAMTTRIATKSPSTCDRRTTPFSKAASRRETAKSGFRRRCALCSGSASPGF